MKNIYTIGRSAECDICIEDCHNLVSREHASIRIDAKGKYWITDMSSNGTYINGIRIQSHSEIQVTRQDEINFAHVENLEWSLIPKPKQSLLWIWVFVLLGILLLGGGVWGGWHLYQAHQTVIPPLIDGPKIDQPTDSIVKRDTTVVEVKKGKKTVSKTSIRSADNHEHDSIVKQEPADTINPEKTNKQNAIY